MEKQQKIDLSYARHIHFFKDKKTGLFYSPDLTHDELVALDEEWGD